MSWFVAVVAMWAGMSHLDRRSRLVVRSSQTANSHLAAAGIFWLTAVILIA